MKCVSGWSAMQNCETPMASDKRRRIARLEQRLTDEQYRVIGPPPRKGIFRLSLAFTSVYEFETL
jgi:hypothetical protein